jgi:hypothetical protein
MNFLKSCLQGPAPLVSALLVSTLFASASSAQDAAPREPFRLHSAINAPDWLTFEGSHRARYSGLANQYRPGLGESDQAISLRTLVTLEADAGVFATGVEFQDARAYLTDDNSGASTIVINSVALLQAWVALQLDDALVDGASVDVRLGRQTIDLGSRRLVARNRFRNTIQNYTGVTVDRTHDDARVYAFLVMPVRVEPGNGDREALLSNEIAFDQENPNQRFWGGFYQQRGLPAGLFTEAYIYGINEQDDPGNFETANRQVYTPGLRIARSASAGDWDAELENVVQFGTRNVTAAPTDNDSRSVFAHYHFASAGYTFAHAWAPRVAWELDYATGQRAGGDQYTRFDSLYGPRRAEFGPTGIYGPMGRENIVSQGVRMSAKPHPRLSAFVSWRANWLAVPSDTFARFGVRDPAGNSGNFAGHQLEFMSRFWVVPQSIQWELGAAGFFNGEFIETAPNATGFGNTYFAYTDVSLFF